MVEQAGSNAILEAELGGERVAWPMVNQDIGRAVDEVNNHPFDVFLRDVTPQINREIDRRVGKRARRVDLDIHAGIDQGQRVNLRNDAYQVMMNIDMTTLGPAVQEQVRLSVPGVPVELRVRRAAPPPDPMPPCYSPVEILAVR